MPEIIASTYELLGKIGSGGGGTVFLANHIRLGKKVVLKADKRKLTTRPELLRREVDVLKDLNHPYIPKVYDFFVENETVYTVMDYIQGESLDKALKRGEKFSQAQVIVWAEQLLTALDYLHSPTHGSPPRGFVHSDIKPANLMRTENNDICLIDFNIALALGEANVVGCSIGYASPEHYGLDFSSDSEMDSTEEKTVTDDAATEVLLESASSKKIVVPDVRSDIYSMGATLYHLLCGRRPAKNAKEVVLLSDEEFSPQIVKIITKAMNPNPDLRYQTAGEMLQDFLNLRKNDVRVKAHRRKILLHSVIWCALFLEGACLMFVGLKRMQITENWLKLAQYSQKALQEGKTELAVSYALQALPEKTGILQPEYTAEAQRALAEAMGVYDLSDGYKLYGEIELPSAPFYIKLAPDGRTAVCIYAYEAAIIDTETTEIIAVLPTAESALSEAEYLDNTTIVFAGKEGLQAYDLEKETTLWKGQAATAICVSDDKKTVAAIYKDDTYAVIYDAETGQIKSEVDFGGKYQHIVENDIFANPGDNLFALNETGTWLGVSFADGSLQLFDLLHPKKDILMFHDNSGYTHFEGGFYEEYFAFSAVSASDSVFAVIDTEKQEQMGGFESERAFGAEADKEGICVCTDNILVKIHPLTGEQTPLVTTAENILHFSTDGRQTAIVTENGLLFFDKNAVLVARQEMNRDTDFLELACGTVVLGNRNSPVLLFMRHENYEETEIFSYDSAYAHDEARVSADGMSVMLFCYDRFRLYGIDGSLIKESEIPNAEEVYDQQYVRDGKESRLEVIYNDGTVRVYSARTGEFLYQEAGEKPDVTLYEKFYTDSLWIESPLHGSIAAYDRKTGRKVYEWEEDAYLTYVTQVGKYIIVQYVTTEGVKFGHLLDEKCRVLADLPYLCDVTDDRLIFDYPTGNMRETRIYDIEELIEKAQEK